MNKYFLISTAVILLLASCVTTKQINYLQKPSVVIPDYADTVGFREYRLQRGDYLSIKVYSLNKNDNIDIYNGNGMNVSINGADNPSQRLYLYMIDEDGNIDYPYLGKIAALGKTTREVKFELEDAFKSNISKYISVDVFLTNRSFSIIGESGSKRINLPHEKVTIFQALAMAGDLSVYSDRSKIKLVRLTEKGTVVKEFDLRTEKIIDSEFYYIQPNDVIYVQHTFSKYVGIQHITNAISVTLSTISFGTLIYKLGDRYSWWDKIFHR